MRKNLRNKYKCNMWSMKYFLIIRFSSFKPSWKKTTGAPSAHLRLPSAEKFSRTCYMKEFDRCGRFTSYDGFFLFFFSFSFLSSTVKNDMKKSGVLWMTLTQIKMRVVNTVRSHIFSENFRFLWPLLTSTILYITKNKNLENRLSQSQ